MHQIKASQNQFSSMQQISLAVLFAGLLSISFLDHDHFYFAWIAFVPLLFAIEKASLKKVYCIGVLAGFLLFVCATYWVHGYIILAKELGSLHSMFLALIGWFYSAQVIAIILLLYAYLKRLTKVHEFILFPIVVAAVTATFPMLFAMRLGESQVNFYYALQAIEFFGVHSLDAIIALFNVVVYRLLCIFSENDKQLLINSKKPIAFSLIIFTLWFFYGVIAYHSWNDRIAKWDTIKIGLVQANETPGLKRPIRYSEYSTAYPPEMEMTTRLKHSGAELVIWPEAQSKNYLNNPMVKAAYSQTIKEVNINLLFQDTLTAIGKNNSKQNFNMAMMLGSQGHEIGSYKKIKRIPIGEYFPFADQSEFVRSLVPSLIGDSTKELLKGTQFEVFKLPSVNIIPLICYETTFPSFVGAAVKESFALSNKSNGSILVALSNGGWFKSIHQTNQHILASKLRAIENRMPFVHAANNGLSSVFLPNGKQIFASDYQQAGGYLVDVPYFNTSSGSFYSKFPNLFLYLLYTIICLLVLGSVFKNNLEQ